ncbi:MAG: response regulator [Myxococcota bacterium]
MESGARLADRFRPWAWWNEGLDRFLTARPHGDDPDERRRRRLAASLHVLGLVVIPLPLVAYLMTGDSVRMWIQVGIWIATLAVLVGLRYGLRSAVSGHLMCLMFMVVVLVEGAQSEGVHAPITITLIIVPFIHTVVVRGWTSWVWCGVGSLVLVGLVVYTPGSVAMAVHKALAVWTVMASVTGGAALFERSRRINMQALWEATRRAEAAVEVKSRFLATMSHEIRTPLSGVLGMLTVLRDSRLTRDQLEHVRTAQNSGLALLDLINDVLDFSKIEAGHMKLEHQAFDLRTLVEDVLDQVAVRASEKGLALVGHYEPATPTHVQGDPGRVRQVLLNLVNNAVKFTAQGYVRMAVRHEPSPTGPVFRCTVEDTGIGISSDDEPRVFEQFQQVGGSRRPGQGGTGLGLSIVRELTGLMGGRAGLRSTLGEGSSFWVDLPLAVVRPPGSEPGPESEPEPEPEPEPESAELSGRRVLVVDDRPIVRASLRATLSEWGVEPTEASTAEEAVEHLRAAARRQRPVDVTLVSEQRPGLGALAEQIDADERLGGSRCLMVVPVTHRSQAQQQVEAGGADYVVEPVRRSRLLEALREALRDALGDALGDARVAPRRDPAGSDPQPTPSGVSSSPGSVARGRRILLVEDDATNRQVAAILLRRLGAEVDVAGDGQEAVVRVEAARYDLVLMDVEMPRMSGLQAAASIRERERGRGPRVPIVAMTAHAQFEDRKRCLAAGMDDHLCKPFRREELLAVLDAHLRASPPAVALRDRSPLSRPSGPLVASAG